MNLISCLLFTVYLFAATLPKEASQSLYDEYEGVRLAEALFRDGKVEAAKVVLRGIDESPQVNRLWGDIFLQEGDLRKSKEYLLKALQSRYEISETNIQLAKLYQRQEDFSGCAASMEAAGDSIYTKVENVLLKAGCEKKIDRKKAWQTVRKAADQSSFPIFLERVKIQLHLSIIESTYAEILERAEGFVKPSEFLSLAEAFTASAQKEKSIQILEWARIRWPLDQDISLALGQLYHEKHWLRSALQSFEVAAISDLKYTEHVTELSRQLGLKQSSLRAQLSIPTEKERVRMKLALSVEANQWDQVACMDNLLRRSDFQDDEIDYAMAFSLLRLGDVDRAMAYLGKIQSGTLIGKAAALQKAAQEKIKQGALLF